MNCQDCKHWTPFSKCYDKEDLNEINETLHSKLGVCEGIKAYHYYYPHEFNDALDHDVDVFYTNGDMPWAGEGVVDTRYDFYCKRYCNIEDYEKQYRLIFGIIASDDLSGCEANLHTMNDLDIIYDSESKKYNLSIETIYEFKDKLNGSKRYIKRLFNRLTEWMVEKGYDTEYKPNLGDVFTDLLGGNVGFDSIEKLYATFRFLVEKFCDESEI